LVHPVADLTIGPQGGPDEAQAQLRQVGCRRVGGLPRRHDEETGHVVGAVPVLGTGRSQQGVFEGTVPIAHPPQVCKVRRGGEDHTSTGRSAASRSANRW
jgi:hypothetical protein